jgi:hypothetical protein
MLPGETISSGANDGEFGTNGYSELMVCQSAAGYYLGTMYTDESGFEEPGSRESDYFPSRGEAEIALEMWQCGHKPGAR